MIAYCYRSGQIGFQGGNGPIPDGALMIARGPKKIIEPTIHGWARLAYDNETWLVPGCPEAQDDEQAFEALMAFMRRVQKAIERRTAA